MRFYSVQSLRKHIFPMCTQHMFNKRLEIDWLANANLYSRKERLYKVKNCGIYYNGLTVDSQMIYSRYAYN
jgi:hypothetical protein